MTWYGLVRKGRVFAEVRAEKRPGERMTQAETGVTYRTFAEGNAAIASKNRGQS